MPSRYRLLSVFVTTLLLSLVVHLPIATPSGMDAAVAQPSSLEDQRTEADRLYQQGSRQVNTNQFQQALQSFEQALAIYRDIGDRHGEGATLNNLGAVYADLGQYQQALDYYHQVLEIRESINDRDGMTRILNRIAIIYEILGQHQQAVEYRQQASVISSSTENHDAEALHNTGLAYYRQGQYFQALNYYKQALNITVSNGDHREEIFVRNSIGIVYQRLEQYEQSLEHYQKALAISINLSMLDGEALTLSNIGNLLSTQDQPELAVIFFKQSVNRYETIRDSNQALSQELQASYTGTIEVTYRRLADLLLQQDRILEAQQVLDLLKVQELDDYLRGVRGAEDQLTILQPEQEILNQYNELQKSAIEVGQELAELRQRVYQGETLTEAETQRVDELEALQEAINNDFGQFIDRKEIQDLVAQLSLRVVQQNIDLADLAGLQDDLTRLNAVLLYPLILDDRLELILTTPNAPPLRRVVDVSKADLTHLISDLRLALRDPNSDPTPLAQQLYGYLIEPIAADLAQVKANLPAGQTPTIIYAPDGALRYIPLAVLHDGEQWLVQSYRINNITAKSLTEFQSEPVSHPRVLAGAFADETISYRVAVGDQEEEFRGLPHAGEEVASLIATSPGIPPLLDRNFSWTTVRRYLGASDIVHFATHAAFVPGTPEDSFILFGNGDRAVLECVTSPTSDDSLSCINNWSLSNIDLVVLSACETGLSGELGSDATGEEILGLGYQFQDRGARAVVASLWKVSDGGTQALMNAFYAALQQDGITKSEAIRQAQIALITGDYTALEDESRGIVELRQRIEANVSPDIASHLSHPYYWAPFILIGNGL